MRLSLFSSLSTLLLLSSSSFLPSSVSASSSSPRLSVYSYDSFLASGSDGFNFATAYETYKSWPAGSVLVTTVPSFELAEAAADPSLTPDVSLPYPADVVLGMDQVTELLAPEVFADVVLTDEAYVKKEIGNLGHFTHIKPFDYGLVTIVYDAFRQPTLPSNSSTFTFDWLLSSGFINQLVVENPNKDTPGLAFLLSTIAVFGDKSLGITGVGSSSASGAASEFIGDWKDWWLAAFETDMMVVDHWGDAFNIASNVSNTYDLYVSYGTDPAYNLCNGYNSTDLQVLIHHDRNHTAVAWAQVEGMAVTGRAQNQTEAVEFLNWLFSPSVQNLVYLDQYMIPASTLANSILPTCYQQSAGVVLPNAEHQLLNTGLWGSGAVTTDNVNSWLSEWESLREQVRGGGSNANAGIKTGASGYFTLTVGLVAVMISALFM